MDVRAGRSKWMIDLERQIEAAFENICCLRMLGMSYPEHKNKRARALFYMATGHCLCRASQDLMVNHQALQIVVVRTCLPPQYASKNHLLHFVFFGGGFILALVFIILLCCREN